MALNSREFAGCEQTFIYKKSVSSRCPEISWNGLRRYLQIKGSNITELGWYHEISSHFVPRIFIFGVRWLLLFSTTVIIDYVLILRRKNMLDVKMMRQNFDEVKAKLNPWCERRNLSGISAFR